MTRGTRGGPEAWRGPRGETESAPAFRTPGQRRRYRRNLLILLAHKQGMSSRWIADAVGLSRTAVKEIVREGTGKG